MISEPLPRDDGLCVVCEQPIPKTAGKYGDPDGFCSRRHCMEWFGTSLAVDVEMPETSVLAQSIQKAKK